MKRATMAECRDELRSLLTAIKTDAKLYKYKYKCKYGITNCLPCLIPHDNGGEKICKHHQENTCQHDRHGYKIEARHKMKKSKPIYKCAMCGTRTKTLHEIYFGNGRREQAIKYKLQAPLCIGCHTFAHGFEQRAVRAELCQRMLINHDDVLLWLNQLTDPLHCDKAEEKLMAGVEERAERIARLEE